MRVNRSRDPKMITSLYKPKEQIETRRRGDWTIMACIVVIIVVALVRGF